jgi:serine/threonine-protein phosphatase 2A regulatory subunit A
MAGCTSIAQGFGVPVLTGTLLPTLLRLGADSKWRVRRSVINQMSVLVKNLPVKAFEKKLQDILIEAFSDHVFSIRQAACEQIGKIVAVYGGKWAADKFFPAAFAIYDKTTNYIHRMTCLLVIEHCAPQCAADIIQKHLLPLVLGSCVDEVPNVRMGASKTLIAMIPRLPSTIIKTKIAPLLRKMVKDVDSDVSYFAGQALKLTLV